MKFPLSWIKSYLSISESAEELAKILTSIGIEVDALTPLGLHFSGVVVGHVISTTPHPSADTLTCAQVSDGTHAYSIVCGAPNCRPGIKVALARLGAQVGELTILERKLRGEVSQGMLCSHEELGLPSGVEGGILELDLSLKEGSDLATLYAEDVLFEVSLTPNLAHCHSIQGIARELATYFNRPLLEPQIDFSEDGGPLPPLHVEIVAKDLCARYACRIVRGVSVAPSSPWLKRRVEECGLTSVNNIVDLTHLVMLELGQPLHAYDVSKLMGNKIYIRQAQEGETMRILNGADIALNPNHLLICDAHRPIALAGVMGSEHTQVSDTTTDVLIESAYFLPSAIRRSSKQCGLTTEASYRFERGVDPEAVLLALDRAAALIAAECDGEISKGRVIATGDPVAEKKISLRVPRIKQVLGLSLATNEVVDLLKRMFLRVVSSKQDVIHVIAPPYRHDLHAEIDLIEEIARFYGYEFLHPKERSLFCTGQLLDTPLFHLEKRARDLLLQSGLQEFLTCDLISKQEAESIAFTDRHLIHVLNPSSIDQSILRPSLLPGLLTVARHNEHHQYPDVSGFEIGRIHFKFKDQFYEKTVAGILLRGQKDPHYWEKPKGECVDFYDLKGIVQQFLEALPLPEIQFKTGTHPTFHPGRQAIATIEGRELVVLGQVHPKITGSDEVYYAEINIEELLELLQPPSKMTSLPLYPSSQRDWTGIVAEQVVVQQLLDCCDPRYFPLLEEVSVLDLYRGDNLGSGWKSITLRFVYRDMTKTLAQAEVEQEHARVIEKITKTLNGKIKS